ncbi:MAG: glycosyltransferase family 39 protein [Candidatus Woesearchaeota archaeon]
MNINKIAKYEIIEILFLVMLFTSLFFFLNSNPYNNKITHDFPHSYFASDGFAYYFLSQHLNDIGNQKYHPSYSAAGHDNVLWIHGITIYAVTAIFARISGIEVYDSLYFIATLMVVLNALVVYLIIKDYNKKVAIISGAFFAFIFLKNFYFTYLWGQLGAVSGMLFMTGIIWCLMRIDLKKSYIFLIIFFTGTILAHIPEFFFAIGFIIVFLILKSIIESKIPWKNIKNLVISGIISLVITSYYIILFIFGSYKSQGGSFEIVTVKEASVGLRVVSFSDFGIPIIILLLIGIGALLFYLFFKKKFHAAAVMALTYFVIGFGNYAGLGYRAFHVRAFWPFLIAPLFGIGIYFILKMVIKKIHIIFVLLISITAFIFITSSFYLPVIGPGILDKDHWDSFQWINTNTNESARIFLFYGDGYSQDGRLIKRITYFINPEDYIDSLRNNKIKRYYKSELFTLHIGFLMYWKKPLTPGYYSIEENIDFNGYQDVCSFDYIVFDKISAVAPGLAQANMYVEELFKKNNMIEVYSNAAVSIVKNNNPGGNCFEKL